MMDKISLVYGASYEFLSSQTWQGGGGGGGA